MMLSVEEISERGGRWGVWLFTCRVLLSQADVALCSAEGFSFPFRPVLTSPDLSRDGLTRGLTFTYHFLYSVSCMCTDFMYKCSPRLENPKRKSFINLCSPGSCSRKKHN